MGRTIGGVDPAGASRRRITVINDNPDFLGLMRELLGEESGYQVTTIDGDTIQDVEPIRASRPDLLVIDLRWRQDGLAGWDILLTVRRDDELGELPIILCTGDRQALEEHAEEILRDPMVETLRKPFQVKDLESLVRQFIGEPTAS
jgi:CheY-like chemotaxis protein